MRSKNMLSFVALLLIALAMTACGPKTEAPDPGLVLTEAAQIAKLTTTAMAELQPPTATLLPPTETPTTAPTATPTATADLTALPSASPQALFTQAAATATRQTANVASDCYKAGFTYDGPPADYTHFHGTVTFTKEWRIQNLGTCTWDSDVYLVHFATTIIENGVEVRDSAETFGQGTEIGIITDPVPPYGFLDIAIDFTAPETGNETYKVYYKLYGPAGVFNISGGSIWFIVDVTPP